MPYYEFIYTFSFLYSYEEHGVYGTFIDPEHVPLQYVGPIYDIQYTGVTSYELNGTTYYSYNVYEVPVFR